MSCNSSQNVAAALASRRRRPGARNPTAKGARARSTKQGGQTNPARRGGEPHKQQGQGGRRRAPPTSPAAEAAQDERGGRAFARSKQERPRRPAVRVRPRRRPGAVRLRPERRGEARAGPGVPSRACRIAASFGRAPSRRAAMSLYKTGILPPAALQWPTAIGQNSAHRFV